MKEGLNAAALFSVQLAPRSSLNAMCVWSGSVSSSIEVTYTRCVPGMQPGTALVQGAGPPTRIATSPMSLPKMLLIGVWTNVRPPSSERATCRPPACQATQMVPSDRSTATDGSVAFVWLDGETCVVNPVVAKADWVDNAVDASATTKIDHLFLIAFSLPTLLIRSLFRQEAGDRAGFLHRRALVDRDISASQRSGIRVAPEGDRELIGVSAGPVVGDGDLIAEGLARSVRVDPRAGPTPARRRPVNRGRCDRVRRELLNVGALVDEGQVAATELHGIEPEVAVTTVLAGNPASAGNLGAGAARGSAVERVTAVVRHSGNSPARLMGEPCQPGPRCFPVRCPADVGQAVVADGDLEEVGQRAVSLRARRLQTTGTDIAPMNRRVSRQVAPSDLGGGEGRDAGVGRQRLRHKHVPDRRLACAGIRAVDSAAGSVIDDVHPAVPGRIDPGEEGEVLGPLVDLHRWAPGRAEVLGKTEERPGVSRRYVAVDLTPHGVDVPGIVHGDRREDVVRPHRRRRIRKHQVVGP